MEWVEVGEEPPAKLAAKAGISPLLSRLLYSRGHRDYTAIDRFLDPEIVLMDLDASPGFREVLELLAQAGAQRWRIRVCAGCGVGELVAVALYVDGLRQLGLEVAYRIGDHAVDALGEVGVDGIEIPQFTFESTEVFRAESR